jgi:acyl-CoA thioesterase-1
MHQQRTLFTFFIVVLSVLSLTGCGDSGSSSGSGGGGGSSGAAPVTKLLVLGDSIGNGFGIATPFSVRIARARGVPLINDSVSGRDTGGGLAVVAGLLARHKPSHMAVLLGTNDARKGNGGAVSNLQAIVNAGNSAGVTVVVGTLPPITRSSVSNSNSAAISNGIRGLNGAAIARVRGALGNGSSTIADGIHPNSMGQQIIADEFLKHL